MIITRTPFRMSFVGGGSDFKEFYNQQPGAVVSITIDKYMFLSMHPSFIANGYFLKYSENEIIDNVEKIRHSIIREVFKAHDIKGVDFNSSSDVPAGTGLGSSASFTVGLLTLCYAHSHKFMKREDIAKEACHIEIDILKHIGGKQDQYAAAMGGLNFIQFNPDESVMIERISLSLNKLIELEKSLMLFYLGNNRPTSSILVEQKNGINKNFKTIEKMTYLAATMRDELKNGCLDHFGEILHTNWCYKKELANNISNSTIDSLYYLAIKNGAEGGKVLGTGGAGFLLLIAPQEKQDKIRNIIHLPEFPFKFENSGAIVIY